LKIGSVLRKVGLAIAYFYTTVYIISIVLPAIYCLRTGCKGAGEGDAFMPAFFLGPWGIVATAFSLHNAIQHIRERQSWSWIFWPLAIVFGIVLVATIAFFGWVIFETATHRR
jgi:hypothetical protein